MTHTVASTIAYANGLPGEGRNAWLRGAVGTRLSFLAVGNISHAERVDHERAIAQYQAAMADGQVH